jgi:hypothetical protein
MWPSIFVKCSCNYRIYSRLSRIEKYVQNLKSLNILVFQLLAIKRGKNQLKMTLVSIFYDTPISRNKEIVSKTV